LLEEEKEYISCPNKLQADPEILPTLSTPWVPPSIPTTSPSPLTPLPLTRQSTSQSPPPLPKAPRDISSTIDPDNIILGSRTWKYAKSDSAHLATANFGLTFALALYEANQLDGDPKNLVQARAALDSAQFEAAMAAEKEQHELLGTWKLVDLPPGRKAINSLWVFKQKRNNAGEIARHKARLVADGLHQIPGVDFLQTYTPTIRLETFHFIIALAAHYKLQVHGMDVVAAYLNGKLDEEVYMKQPPGFNDGTGRVCKLILFIYSLKQAGRNWNIELDTVFKSLGFIQLIADQCVYVCRDPASGSPTIVTVHVDDMTLCARTDTELSQLKGELASKFKVMDLGELTQILGMEVQHDSSDGSIRLSQVNYITRMLESVGMSNCNPIATPIDPNVKLMPLTDGDPCIGNAKFQHDYLSGLGKLMYPAVTTHPDLTHAIQHLSQFSI